MLPPPCLHDGRAVRFDCACPLIWWRGIATRAHLALHVGAHDNGRVHTASWLQASAQLVRLCPGCSQSLLQTLQSNLLSSNAFLYMSSAVSTQPRFICAGLRAPMHAPFADSSRRHCSLACIAAVPSDDKLTCSAAIVARLGEHVDAKRKKMHVGYGVWASMISSPFSSPARRVRFLRHRYHVHATIVSRWAAAVLCARPRVTPSEAFVCEWNQRAAAMGSSAGNSPVPAGGAAFVWWVNAKRGDGRALTSQSRDYDAGEGRASIRATPAPDAVAHDARPSCASPLRQAGTAQRRTQLPAFVRRLRVLRDTDAAPAAVRIRLALGRVGMDWGGGDSDSDSSPSSPRPLVEQTHGASVRCSSAQPPRPSGSPRVTLTSSGCRHPGGGITCGATTESARRAAASPRERTWSASATQPSSVRRPSTSPAHSARRASQPASTASPLLGSFDPASITGARSFASPPPHAPQLPYVCPPLRDPSRRAHCTLHKRSAEPR